MGPTSPSRSHWWGSSPVHPPSTPGYSRAIGTLDLVRDTRR
jgi:hypothetical protein